MEDRQRMDQHIARLPAPIVFQHDRIAQQVAMREHGALAAACGAAGVEDGREVVRAANSGRVLVGLVHGALQKAATAVVTKREHMLRTCSKGDL